MTASSVGAPLRLDSGEQAHALGGDRRGPGGEDFGEEVLLLAEMVVQRRKRHLGLGGDGADADAVPAMGREQPLAGIQQALPHRSHLRFRGFAHSC